MSQDDKTKPKPWEDHNFGVLAEPVYCLECKAEIDPRLDDNVCPQCEFNSLFSIIERKG